jgi:ribokinase
LRAVFLGALNMDQVVRVAALPRPGETVTGADLLRAPGGKGANQAVAAARLGAAASMVGRVGRDAFGRELSRSLREAGVSTRWVHRGERPTGTALIFVDERGENVIAVAPGANEELDPDDVPRRAIESATVVVATLEAPRGSTEQAFRRARLAGVRTVLNAAPARAIPNSLLELCDVVICNETELASLLGTSLAAASDARTARQLRAFPKQIVVVTLGAGGALAVVGNDEDVVRQPAFAVPAVDTVGAGDAFVAAFVVGGAMARSPEDVATALRWGCAAGSLATTRYGAQPSMPSLPEVEALLEKGQAPRRRANPR